MAERTSLVIATLDRPADLARCLRSIGRLRRGFDEIIIVDQGDAKTTERIVADHPDLDIRIRRQAARSLTRARNAGVEQSTGDLVFFVDDDTELDPGYLEAAVNGFARHPDVVGLTGFVDQGEQGRTIPWRLCKRLAATVLLTASFRWKVLRSGANSFPVTLWFGRSRFQRVPFSAGGHFAFRRSVFDAGFRFDERLILWGFGEDVMFSYQIHKHYGPDSLAYLPEFRLRHYRSPERSLTDEAAVRMQMIYRFIFWRQEVYEGSFLNAVCYLYSQVGFSLSLLKTYRRTPLRTLRAIVSSAAYLLMHHREIADGRVDYNRFITRP